MSMTPAEKERFFGKTVRQGDCLVWTGPLDKDGYGSFYFRRNNRRAHRVGYYSVHGEIPEGHVINHRCQNRACVNPQHLEAATVLENNERNTRSIPYLNSKKTHCKNGHPFDKVYGKQRYCSICQSEKKKRLRAKWALEDRLNV